MATETNLCGYGVQRQHYGLPNRRQGFESPYPLQTIQGQFSGRASDSKPLNGGSIPPPCARCCMCARMIREVIANHLQAGSIPVTCSKFRLKAPKLCTIVGSDFGGVDLTQCDLTNLDSCCLSLGREEGNPLKRTAKTCRIGKHRPTNYGRVIRNWHRSGLENQSSRQQRGV